MTGNRRPITPVEEGKTSSEAIPRASPVQRHIFLASSIPVCPVATFAIFELTTMACSCPFCIFSRPTVTGAPGKLFRVNTPAAVHLHSDAITPKSNV